MAETTEQYKARITQIKSSIVNEPYIEKMRDDIAEGIYETGSRQADIEDRQGTLEVDFAAVQQDASSASPSGAEVAVARGGLPTLDARLTKNEQEVTAQLAQKANETDVRKKLDPIGVNDFDEETLGVIQNGTEGTPFELLSIPRDSSVTEEKTTFIRKSRNSFNKQTVTIGKTISSTGFISDAPGWVLSDFIPVSSGLMYSKNKQAVKVVFDSSKNYLTGYGNNNLSYTIVANGAFVRLALLESELDSFQYEQNSISTLYESYGTYFNELLVTEDNVSDESIGNEKIKNGTLSETKLNFIEKNDNLFNIETVLKNKKIEDTGVVSIDVTSNMSDYIPVEASSMYSPNKQCGVVQFDSQLNYLTGSTRSTSGILTSNKTAFVILDIPNNSLLNFKFEKGVTTDYSDFGSAIKSTIKPSTNLKELAYKIKENKQSFTSKIRNGVESLFDLNYSITASNGRVFNEYGVIWKEKEKSLKIETLGTTTTDIRFILNNYELIGLQEINLKVYIPDVSKITQIAITMVKETGSWSRFENTLKNGWNNLRFLTTQGDTVSWTYATQLRINAYVTAQTDFYIGDVTFYKPEKAKMIMVNDHGYSGFKTSAYPRLKAVGIPTTWAINPGRLAMPISGASSILSQIEIDELAADSYSEFSFHTWNPLEKATADMTALELKTDSQKCIHYLKKNGILPKYLWRAAFTQNKAPYHEAIQSMVEGYASPIENAGMQVYPFYDRYNIGRQLIHGRSNAWFDDVFDKLKKTRSLVVFYTHDISDSGGIHMTNAELNYFISKVEQGVSEGWLEGTTFNQLKVDDEKLTDLNFL